MSTSIWNDSVKMPTFSHLHKNIETEVCVIGGGLGGLITAYLLQRRGKKVVLLESKELGSGQTGYTTAQWVTALDDRYYNLERYHGLEGIQLAADSHRTALDVIEHIVKTEAIDCELKRLNGYLFLGDGDQPEILNREIDACHRAGLLDVYKLDAVPQVTFATGPALCFPRQIELHPLKLLKGLAQCFVRDGGQIFNHTHVVDVKGGEDACVRTESKFEVRADAIVVATNSPINDMFAIHTKQAPYRTYVVGYAIPRGSFPDVMMWDTPDPYHYIRVQAHPTEPTLDVLIVGGEDHKTGQESHPEESFRRLEQWTKARFKMVHSEVYRWSGQVMEPVDGLGFLGHNPMDRDNVYVITGDSGNGMTHCTIGGLIIRDQILGIKNAWEKLYQPSRKTMVAISEFIKENANVAAQYADWVAPGDVKSVDDIAAGEGAVIRRGGMLIAAYRDEEGKLDTMSAACPHLGAAVRWNSAEKSWDCPCHGSRFDAHGKVIEGPACSHLKKTSRDLKASLTAPLMPANQPRSEANDQT